MRKGLDRHQIPLSSHLLISIMDLMIHRFTLSIYTVGLKLLVTFVQFTRFEKTTTLAIEGPSSLDWKIATCSPFISLGSKC